MHFFFTRHVVWLYGLFAMSRYVPNRTVQARDDRTDGCHSPVVHHTSSRPRSIQSKHGRFPISSRYCTARARSTTYREHVAHGRENVSVTHQHGAGASRLDDPRRDGNLVARAPTALQPAGTCGQGHKAPELLIMEPFALSKAPLFFLSPGPCASGSS
jgi:hypothetical protein